MMQDDDLKYWLALKAIDGIGNASIASLSDIFSTMRDVFSASPVDLIRQTGLSPAQAQAIADFSDWGMIAKSLDRAYRAGMRIYTCRNKDYPARLLSIYDSPSVLYVRGRLQPKEVCVAIVGSRQASAYGRYTTEKISRELALSGITVVSGLARGIDSCAHRGALAARGRTIAVLGCGLDVVYPPENKKLCEDIAENGALVSEYPPGAKPLPFHFPARNRIISGLSYGVVVVEAGEKSGSLITARLAGEQGREVFAIPGSIDSVSSRGANSLIKQGAKLIDSIDDILEEIVPQLDKDRSLTPLTSKDANGRIDDTISTNALTASTFNGDEIIRLLTDCGTLHIDDLIARAGLPAGEIMGRLIRLEIEGIIEQSPGKYFMLKK